jgi:hypothetical protein
MNRVLSILLLGTGLSMAEIPEIDTRPVPNISDITMNIEGRTIITQKQFADQNFTDVKDVLNLLYSLSRYQQQTTLLAYGIRD